MLQRDLCGRAEELHLHTQLQFDVEPGDHIIRIGADGFRPCRFTLRDLRAGQSATLKALLEQRTAPGTECGLIGVKEQLGKMTRF